MKKSTTRSMLFHMGGVPAGVGDTPLPFYDGHVYFVDGTHGADTYDGETLESALATIDAAVGKCQAGDTIYVLAKEMAATDTDPGSYAETITLDVPQVSVIGVSRGRTQGGMPQVKKGSGSTALLTIAAPGCLVMNMGFNGVSCTGGGILMNDDGGTTYAAFGTSIIGCHFKNCVGSTATNAATGGAIMWSANGGAWQTLIRGNRFYKNVGDVVLKGTGSSVPQDVVIEDNVFSGPAANVDCNLFLKGGGDGINGLIVRNNVFTAIPALSSGVNAKFMDLTGCVGILCGNMFACEDGRTFGAAGDELVPTTVFMAGNFSEKAAAQVANGGDVYRT